MIKLQFVAPMKEVWVIYWYIARCGTGVHYLMQETAYETLNSLAPNSDNIFKR